MQLLWFLYFQPALHVSGDVFAHHQEHITVTTAVYRCCCWLVLQCATPASSNIGDNFQKLQLQRYAPDDGRKHRPKHVELTGSKEITTVASCWLSIVIVTKKLHSTRSTISDTNETNYFGTKIRRIAHCRRLKLWVMESLSRNSITLSQLQRLLNNRI